MLKVLKHHWSRRTQLLMKLRAEQALLGLVLGLLLAGAVVVWQLSKDQSRVTELKRAAQQVTAQETIPPNGKNIGGPFTLTDQDGQPVSDTAFRGKYLIVYFGYTYCPDLCPTGLESIAHALDQLGDDAKKVQPLFITIDPARDTPARLKAYSASFHPDIISLTGTAAQIATVAKEYQVYYAKGETVDEGEYMMDHSSLIYLMDPAGKFIATFEERVDPAILVKAVREQMQKQKAD